MYEMALQACFYIIWENRLRTMSIMKKGLLELIHLKYNGAKRDTRKNNEPLKLRPRCSPYIAAVVLSLLFITLLITAANSQTTPQPFPVKTQKAAAEDDKRNLPRSATATYEDKECLSCHSTTIKSKKLKHTIDPVLRDTFKPTPHAKMKCVDCHSSAVLSDKPKKHMEKISKLNCSQCHYKGNDKGAPNEDIEKEFHKGIHGKQKLDEKNNDAPGCKDCHSAANVHDIRRPSDPKSSVNRMNIYLTCGRCHGKKELMKKYKLTPDIFLRYKKSVHGRALLEKGLNVIAVCTDCHGNHDVRPPSDPVSYMNRKKIPVTCGRCHQGIMQTYRKSIHGKDWAKGNKDVPVCTSCHGEHNILAPDQAASMVNTKNIGNTCSRCHERKPLLLKYGLPMNRLQTYKSSYHGTVIQLNDVSVANCASCHGTHNILPSSDPKSTVNPKNLAKTCGRVGCHPNARANKNITKIHVGASLATSKLLFIIKYAYILIILGSVGGFLFYIATDLVRVRRERKQRKRK